MAKQNTTAWVGRRLLAGALFFLVVMLFSAPLASDQDPTAADNIPRHPLELQALSEPDAVLKQLPKEIAAASGRGDQRELALLHLAEANACRVIANWTCQRQAGSQAVAAAKAAAQPILAVRGLIAEGRGSIAMQDFTRGESLLGDAELLLKRHPFPELSGDVFLAYSSLSNSLVKHALAAEYAERGIEALADEPALSIRIRLLRNLARAQAQLDKADVARATLIQAQQLSERHSDPKLTAELYLEAARMASLVDDIPGQVSNAHRVLELAGKLRNSQLDGLGREVLGLAAASSGDLVAAERELRASHASFRGLGLDRDELRVLRELIKVMLLKDRSGGDVNGLMTRFLERSHLLEQAERAQASDDFAARLKYAAQELEVLRLESEAMLAQEREKALGSTQKLTLALALLGGGVFLVLAVFFLFQKRSTRRLQNALDRLGESESRYRMLADNSRDMVVRMRLDGHRLYMSPSVSEMLGRHPDEMVQPRWDLLHPDDREPLQRAMQALGETGGSATVVYRAMHRDGHYVWIEALARLVDGPEGDGHKEIVYSGRDISARVRAEQAVAASERFLRGVTDNIPASITHIGSDEKIDFANAHAGRMMRMDPASMIGMTVREVRGDAAYTQIQPYLLSALAGEKATFEGQTEFFGKPYYFQSNYIPDLAPDGSVRGLFALTFDITDLKNAEFKLERLARFDGLTGVANRRHFDERLATALSRGKRQGYSLALLWLDIDHFKHINDGHGHPAGDAVLREFAARLQSCVREEDLVARVGGDEFAILIEGANSAQDVEAVAGKLMALMKQELPLDDGSLRVTTSIGIAFSKNSVNADRLTALADEALYAAKAAGRNAFRMVECD